MELKNRMLILCNLNSAICAVFQSSKAETAAFVPAFQLAERAEDKIYLFINFPLKDKFADIIPDQILWVDQAKKELGKYVSSLFKFILQWKILLLPQYLS